MQSQFENVYHTVPPLMECIIAQCGDILPGSVPMPRGSAIKLLRLVSPAIGKQANAEIKKLWWNPRPGMPESVGREVDLLKTTRLETLHVTFCPFGGKWNAPLL